MRKVAMNLIELNKNVVTRLLAVFESGELPVFDDVVADDYVHNIENFPSGRDALKQYVRSLRAAVPDLAMPILDMVAEGDRVAVRNRVSGTLQADFGPWKANGNRFDISVFHIYRVSAGLAVEHWEALDKMELNRQLSM
jgi:predicted ester cyclase